MKVLMITGDKNFVISPRYPLQAAAVEKFEVVYWGRGSMWPRVPPGPYEVVTAQDPFWRGLLAWYIARRIGAKLNIQVHADLAAESFFRHVLAQIVLRHADSVRVVSLKLKQQVERMGVHAPIHVLPIFIDVSRFRALEHQAHAQKTILWIGRFEKEKDPFFALDILKQIRTAGTDAKLIMLGSGSMERCVRHAAKELPIEFPGWQDSAPYLEIADVVISTSRQESYGASIVEALAASVPVVAPDVGIAREAGAIVVPKSDFGRAVVEVLNASQRGELKIQLPSASEWAKRWKETLV